MRASISSMLSFPGMSAMASLNSSDVLLHHFRIAGVGLRRVEPELAPRAALAQQVPALVELGLQLGQPVTFLGAEFTLLEKPVLLIGQPLDMRKDRSILVGLGHGLSSGDASTIGATGCKIKTSSCQVPSRRAPPLSRALPSTRSATRRRRRTT